MGKTPKLSKDDLANLLEQASENIEVKQNPSNEVSNSIKSYERKVISDWKLLKPQPMTDIAEFEIAKHLLLVTIRGHSISTIITGDGGIGKTYLTVSLIKSELKSEEWEYKNGFTSPLAFYKYLFHNANKKLLILDDIEGLFGNEVGISLLKSALWDVDGKRLIQYDTTSEKANDVPSIFELKARLIVLCNKIPNIFEKNMTALLSRTVHYELLFSRQQILAIIKHILYSKSEVSKAQKDRVWEIINKETTEATNSMNIRTMEKLIAFVRYNPEKALDLFRHTTTENDDEALILKFMNANLSTEKQAERFFNETGKSRRTFFRIKKRLSAKVSSKNDVTNGTVKNKQDGNIKSL